MPPKCIELTVELSSDTWSRVSWRAADTIADLVVNVDIWMHAGYSLIHGGKNKENTCGSARNIEYRACIFGVNSMTQVPHWIQWCEGWPLVLPDSKPRSEGLSLSLPGLTPLSRGQSLVWPDWTLWNEG